VDSDEFDNSRDHITDKGAKSAPVVPRPGSTA
jgi:hypothetical protein